jgi:hypothetical protein
MTFPRNARNRVFNNYESHCISWHRHGAPRCEVENELVISNIGPVHNAFVPLKMSLYRRKSSSRSNK